MQGPYHVGHVLYKQLKDIDLNVSKCKVHQFTSACRVARCTNVKKKHRKHKQ